VVVGLPRGGIPVAYEVAQALGAPLDVLVVRKLGCPWQPELGVGALGEDDIRLLNEPLMRATGVTEPQLEAVAAREGAELQHRVRRYRGERGPIPVTGRTVIVVDDGLATGFSARAGIEVLRRRGVHRIVLAVPVAPSGAVTELQTVADIQGGTTREGIHLGAMTGTLDLVQRGYTGLTVEQDQLHFDPALPTEVPRLDLLLYYRGHHLRVSLTHEMLRVSAPVSELAPVSIGCNGQRGSLSAGETVTFVLTSTDRN
jgi:adenine/guanine phosphoribosyltransferase-like PRPP-binding protein